MGDFISNNEIDATTNSLEVSKLKQNLTPNQQKDKNEKTDKQTEFMDTLSDFGNLNNFLNSNINQELDKISVIQNNLDIEDTFHDDQLYSLINNTNNNQNKAENKKEFSNILPSESKMELTDIDISKTNTSFISLKSSETMGLDFNQFANNQNNDSNMTIHGVSQTNDLAIIQAVNTQHDKLCQTITKRFSSMAQIRKCWSESNINATIQFLKTKRDMSVINDFFTYGLIARDDVTRLPFTLDHSIDLLPYVVSLINGKYDAYKLTGIKTGMIFIKMLFEKIVMTKQTVKTGGLFEQTDPILQNNIDKCDKIIEIFKKLYQNKNLTNLKNEKLRESASRLYTDIEFFLSPFNKGEGKIKIINTN